LKHPTALRQSTGLPSSEALVSPAAQAASHALKASSPLVPVQSLEPLLTAQFRAEAVRCRASWSRLLPVDATHSASSAESAPLTILGQLKLPPMLEQPGELEWIAVGTMTSPQMFRQPPPARIAAEVMLRLRGLLGSKRARMAQNVGPRQISLPGVALGAGVAVAVVVRVGIQVGVRVAVGALVGVLVGLLVGVSVGWLVGVRVGVLVGVRVAVGVLVGVLDGVFVGVVLGVGVFAGPKNSSAPIS
jgi:hypothetical protein